MKSFRETVNEFEVALYRYTVPSACAIKIEEPFCEAVITVLALVRLVIDAERGQLSSRPVWNVELQDVESAVVIAALRQRGVGRRRDGIAP